MPTDPFSLTNGARFYRCAFQVNSFSYASGKHIAESNELAYNTAIISKLKEHLVEVVAITDHHSVETSRSLYDSARAADIAAFPAFEAETTEGIHVLCLFSPDTDFALIERLLAHCGIVDKNRDTQCDLDFHKLLERISENGGICIAPHVTFRKGLLGVAAGNTRAKCWRDEGLLAIGIPGAVAALDPGPQAIVLNKEPAYQRSRSPAVLNCNDIWDTARHFDAGSGTATLVKMSHPSIEGLRQAFIDPESRVRLLTDPVPMERMQIDAITWDGGFLDGCAIRFNENFNVLIGGRGCGKSTVIESIRFVLQMSPLGADAKKTHESVIRFVLRSGTKVTLSVRTFRPSEKCFTIERTVEAPPIVRDHVGTILAVTPQDVFPGVSLFGQHEIAEVAKGQGYLTSLLSRFAGPLVDLEGEIREHAAALERNRIGALALVAEGDRVAARLETLPALELQIKRYEEAGFGERLLRRSRIESEQQIMESAKARVTELEAALRKVEARLPIKSDFVTANRLRELGDPPGLDEIASALSSASDGSLNGVSTITQAIATARERLAQIEGEWTLHARAVQNEYEATLRQLQVDEKDNEGEQFIKLRRQFELLAPQKSTKTELDAKIAALYMERTSLLADWDELQRQKFRALDDAADKLNASLGRRLRIRVTHGLNREAVHAHVDRLGGRLKELKTAIDEPSFSIRSLASAARAGKTELIKTFGIPEAQANKLYEAELLFKLQLEEIKPEHVTQIELNVGQYASVEWRSLDHLSTGQKATAVLLLLLASQDGPLVIDQPEDDLDNFFISDSVVPEIRAAKRRRQFVFATHNANLPVLGDAELIVGLSAHGEASGGRGTMPTNTMGSIDSLEVKSLVGEVLEGGKVAFLQRREKYGY